MFTSLMLHHMMVSKLKTGTEAGFAVNSPGTFPSLSREGERPNIIPGSSLPYLLIYSIVPITLRKNPAFNINFITQCKGENIIKPLHFGQFNY